MSNPYFSFKQFTVYHNLCAMKVGVDGVLLGAWAECKNIKNGLDVGTGSGLIALMLAQRSVAIIQAIDVDKNACKQAEINFKNAPFSDRLQIEQIAFQDYTSPVKYDLIVSNPPYFVHSLKSPNESRSLARHTDSLSLEILIKKSTLLLNPKGRLSLILPYTQLETAQSLAFENRLFLCRKTNVSSLQGQLPKRVLLEYSLTQWPLMENSFFIGASKQTYSGEYIALTRDFYLGHS